MCDPADVDPISLENLGDIPSDQIIVLEQNNKLFCFDVRTLYTHVFQQKHTTNPLTNQPWTADQLEEIRDRWFSIDLVARSLTRRVTTITARIQVLLGAYQYRTNSLAESLQNGISRWRGTPVTSDEQVATRSGQPTVPEDLSFQNQPWYIRWATEDRGAVQKIVTEIGDRIFLGLSERIEQDTGNFQWLASILVRINAILSKAFENSNQFSTQSKMKLFLVEDTTANELSLGQLLVSMTEFHNQLVEEASVNRFIEMQQLIGIRDIVRETYKQLFESFLERFRDFWIQQAFTRLS